MSAGDYVPGSILQFLDNNGSNSKQKNDVNNLFQASKIVTKQEAKSPTKNDPKQKSSDKTDETKEGQVQTKKKPKAFTSNAEKRIFLKPFKERLQERKKQDSKTIFVGNLPLTTEKKELLTLFKKYGKIESVRFRSMPVKAGKGPKVVSIIKKDFIEKRATFNAYIVFEKEESAKEAIQLNNMEFKGLHLRVDNAAKTTKHSSKNTVFAGNMPYDIEEENVRGFFDSCGIIESVRIVRDPKTLKGKGFAYIEFQDEGSVDIAMSLNGKKFMNRELRVEKCVKKKKSDSSSAVVVSNKRINTSKANTFKQKPKGGISQQKPKSKGQKLKFKEMKEMKKREIIARKLQPNRPKDGKTNKKTYQTSSAKKPNRTGTVKPNKTNTAKKPIKTNTVKPSKTNAAKTNKSGTARKTSKK